MKYVIYNKETRLYYKSTPKGQPSIWVESIFEGDIFTTGDAAKNYARSSIHELFITGVLAYTQIPEEKKVEKKIEYSLAEANKLVDTFVNISQDFYSQVPSLVTFYSNELSKIDGIQEDILHKIEFDNVCGLQAVLLMKKLKEVRIKRREIKDKLAQLKICEVGVSMPKKFNNLENRTYTPRVLAELFN